MELADTKYELDVIALGDLILNFVYGGKSRGGFELYERQPAGATANLLTQVSRLGGKAGLITTLGNDYHGDFLYDYAKKEGIDVSNVTRCNEISTRMMFVHFTEQNDRYFPPFESLRTDLETQVGNINFNLVKNSKAFELPLFFYRKDKPIYEACQEILSVIRKQKGLVGFDCNWRGADTPKAENDAICDAALNVDVVKMTDVELAHYFGETDLLKGSEYLLSSNVKLVAITLAENGCLLRNCNGYVFCPAYDVEVIDTTGAGDSFMGSLLYQLTRNDYNIEELNKEELKRLADFSSACSSYSTMHRGSMSAMATMENVEWIMENVPRHKSIYID